MTLTRVLLKTCVAGALAISLAGCSYLAKAILAPQKDISKFYLLTPTADTAAPASAAAKSAGGDFTIGLGPIKLPPYLDRPEIVTRMAPNRLELSKEDRWGESLQNGFTSAMERDLAAQAGPGRIIVFPWYNTTHIDLQVADRRLSLRDRRPGHRDAVGEMDDPRLNRQEHPLHRRIQSDPTLQTRRRNRRRRSAKPHHRRPERPDRKHAATTPRATTRAPSLTLAVGTEPLHHSERRPRQRKISPEAVRQALQGALCARFFA